MEKAVTTEQLIFKIGVITVENDILKARIEELAKEIAKRDAEILQHKSTVKK